jgi:alpha-methylacyl-CoA racemase
MGPLQGIRVVELKGIGPGPYAGMLLADMGADVIVVERSSQFSGFGVPSRDDVNSRSKRSIALDLKQPRGVEILMQLVEGADVLLEGFRPGVAERLGFGPEECHAINPGLVYGRLTGWGQTGPWAKTAGHDINYISITGVLAAMGTPDKPTAPLNLVGDYAGGSLFLVMGILAALLEAQRSGEGQVVDAAITDGTASLMSVFYGWHRAGYWSTTRGSNLLDGAAYHYNVYETADGKFVSIAPLEPKFYALFVERAGLDEEIFGRQAAAPDDWPELHEKLALVVRQRTQREWCELMDGTDACVAPVLDFLEAPQHPHHRARETYLEVDGLQQPAPAPRFSRTGCDDPRPPKSEGEDTVDIMQELGYDSESVAELRLQGVLT